MQVKTDASGCLFVAPLCSLIRLPQAAGRFAIAALALGLASSCDDNQYRKPAVCAYDGDRVDRCVSPPIHQLISFDPLQSRTELLRFSVPMHAGPNAAKYPIVYHAPAGTMVTVLARVHNTRWYLAQVDLTGVEFGEDLHGYISRHYPRTHEAQLYLESDCAETICIQVTRSAG